MERIPFSPRRIVDMVVMCGVSALAAFAIAISIGFLFSTHATAKEWGAEQGKYAAPDVQDYYKNLKQPDSPTASCCGDADAYYTDKSELDANGNLVAIITDTRPDELTRPDGSKAFRPHIPPGTKIVVPKKKIRKPASENPTDHGIIFVLVSGDESGASPDLSFYVFCYEPLGGM